MRVRLLSYGCSSLFLCIIVFFGVSSSAHAQDTGAITGKVTGDGNAALIDVQVVAYRQINNAGFYSWEPAAQTITDNNGNYTIPDLEADTYRVGFSPQNYPRDYFDAYYGNVTNVDSATDLIVTAGTTVQNINIQLPSGAHIKGKVTGPAGENLQGIAVSVNGLDLSFQKSVTTNASGRYDIGGMEAGTLASASVIRKSHPNLLWSSSIIVGVMKCHRPSRWQPIRSAPGSMPSWIDWA